jgi:hypothetical protein
MRFVPRNYTGNFPTFRTRIHVDVVQNEAVFRPLFRLSQTTKNVPKTLPAGGAIREPERLPQRRLRQLKGSTRPGIPE